MTMHPAPRITYKTVNPFFHSYLLTIILVHVFTHTRIMFSLSLKLIRIILEAITKTSNQWGLANEV